MQTMLMMCVSAPYCSSVTQQPHYAYNTTALKAMAEAF